MDAERPPDKTSLFAAALRDDIVAGRYAPGTRLPTRRELAVRFATTLATTQKALARLEDEQFIVSRGRLGTVVHAAPPHRFHFGLLEETSIPQSRYLRAIREQAARMTGAGPQRFTIYYDIDGRATGPGQERLMADLASRRLAGLVLHMHPEALGSNPVLRAPGVPKVVLAQASSVPGIVAVSTSRESWLRQALAWLRERGRRRVAWLGIPNNMPPALREFHAKARAAGFSTRDGWALAVHPLYANWAANAVDAIFGEAAAERPDALLITDDHLAEAATGALARLPLRIPQDLDIVCLNNFPLPLHTHVPVRQLGFDAARTLQACLDVLERRRAGRRVPSVVTLAAEFATPASAAAPQTSHRS